MGTMTALRAVHIPLFVTLISIGMMSYSEFFLIPALIFMLDTVGRYRDFVKLSRVYQRGPHYTKAFWNRFSVTRCSREVMKAVDPEAKEYYKLVGYRWYHILPDGTFSKSSPFLDIKMLVNLSKTRH